MAQKRSKTARRSPGREAKKQPGSFVPQARVFYEQIGGKEYALPEAHLHVFNDVMLWERNPRIMKFAGEEGIDTEDSIASKLRRTNDYDTLKKSIELHGQLTPVYAWKTPMMKKHLIIEGNTRVTSKRDLMLKYKGQPEEAEFTHVAAKILPPEFTEEDILLLLVGIHVRGSGVRDWDRYVQARTVYDAVNPESGKKPVTTITRLAAHMGRSVSWVSRLVSAYSFAKAYEDHHDTDEAQKEAIKYFSVLEEISKASGFGAKIRDFGNPTYDQLREDVFNMVQNKVFTEYRDARFIQQFNEDAEKWALLKTMEPGIAHTLAQQVNNGGNTIGARIAGLPEAIKKTLVAKPDALGEEHVEHLQESVETLSAYLANANVFRLQLSSFAKSLKKVALGDLEQVTPDELDNLVAQLTKVRGLIGNPN